MKRVIPGKARRRRRLLIALAVLAAIWCAATLNVLVWPPLGSPRAADAIVSLNGPDEDLRQDEALSLAKRGYAPLLLFSVGDSGGGCPVLHQVKVVCFVPHPGRTVGEAEWVGTYAARHNLRSLLVVAGRTQAVRARLIVGRCYPGRIQVVGVDTPARSLPYDIAYGWAALGKALFVDRSC